MASVPSSAHPGQTVLFPVLGSVESSSQRYVAPQVGHALEPDSTAARGLALEVDPHRVADVHVLVVNEVAEIRHDHALLEARAFSPRITVASSIQGAVNTLKHLCGHGDFRGL